jgi:hypothetical protein
LFSIYRGKIQIIFKIKGNLRKNEEKVQDSAKDEQTGRQVKP